VKKEFFNEFNIKPPTKQSNSEISGSDISNEPNMPMQSTMNATTPPPAQTQPQHQPETSSQPKVEASSETSSDTCGFVECEEMTSHDQRGNEKDDHQNQDSDKPGASNDEQSGESGETPSSSPEETPSLSPEDIEAQLSVGITGFMNSALYHDEDDPTTNSGRSPHADGVIADLETAYRYYTRFCVVGHIEHLKYEEFLDQLKTASMISRGFLFNNDHTGHSPDPLGENPQSPLFSTYGGKPPYPVQSLETLNYSLRECVQKREKEGSRDSSLMGTSHTLLRRKSGICPETRKRREWEFFPMSGSVRVSLTGGKKEGSRDSSLVCPLSFLFRYELFIT